ncbi:M20 family metallopeptidase [Chamaesiphon sp. OTE_20_metabat_361]|uniref:M20 metallopeptidase family protein n=1 Tax=Chamaesiphon sp. OTE_20_metabat_361 TaxID=2964689 RepID=UPI00286A1A6E|nr:M20 family metallopeptidase [Chamaesiphon sp. OTE_20_metabat_361]
MFATNAPTQPIHPDKIRSEIQALQPQLVALRRQLHQQPELGFQERITAETIAKKLTEWKIPHQTGIAKTGIVAMIQGRKTSFRLKTLAIRADMDALPIQEANDVPYKSQHDGIMHACGHDGHVAIALMTAYYLSQHQNDFAGMVKIIFQPAEEGPGGAKPMIDEGVLTNPDVNAIIGLHLWNNLPLGTIGVRSGALMAAVELFNLKIQGKGGHGAMPHQTVDAIVVASQIVTALQTIVARNVNPIDSAVVTVGQFNAGNARNVIADTASLTGTVRYFNPDLADFFERRIDAIVAGICAGYGATYQLEYTKLYPPVINDPKITDLVRSVATDLVETPLGVVPECQTMGGEDMSFFLQAVPGCYFFLGAANPDRSLAYPHHHPRFDFDETALATGVEMFVRCVEKFCN